MKATVEGFSLCVLCVCLQQHVRRQILKDFDKSVIPFQKRKGEQRVGNLPASSVSEQCEQQRGNESEMKNIWKDKMERVETHALSMNRDRSRDDLGKENPDSATHTKLPKKKATQDEEVFHVIQQSVMYLKCLYSHA